MLNEKWKRIVAAVIAGVLVLAMVASMVIPYVM